MFHPSTSHPSIYLIFVQTYAWYLYTYFLLSLLYIDLPHTSPHHVPRAPIHRQLANLPSCLGPLGCEKKKSSKKKEAKGMANTYKTRIYCQKWLPKLFGASTEGTCKKVVLSSVTYSILDTLFKNHQKLLKVNTTMTPEVLPPIWSSEILPNIQISYIDVQKISRVYGQAKKHRETSWTRSWC